MTRNPQVTQSSKKKGYKRIYPVLKWILSIASIYYFVQSWLVRDTSLFNEITSVLSKHWIFTLVILCLAILNWSSEALKLRLLLFSELKQPFRKWFFTVLGGMAISNFTPARTGEYIGRGLLLKKIHPVKVVIATVTGNIAQVLMTYFFGLSALLVFVVILGFGEEWLNQDYRIGGAIVSFAVIILVLLFGRTIIFKVLNLLPAKITKVIAIIKRYDMVVVFNAVGIALLRYLAFTIQFFLLLLIFSEFNLPLKAIALVPVAYLFQSLVPVPAVADVGVRVGVSQLLFGEYLVQEQIVIAVTTLWFINLILPGIIGTFHLLISTFRK